MTARQVSIRDPDFHPRERRLRRADRAARPFTPGRTRTLGSFEMAIVLVALAVLTGVALAGLARAQTRPIDAGVAIALAAADVEGSTAAEATVRVDLVNGNLEPFSGRIVVSTEAGQTSANVSAAARATAQVQFKVKAACGERITVGVDGPDAPDEPLDVTVDCSGVGG